MIAAMLTLPHVERCFDDEFIPSTGKLAVVKHRFLAYVRPDQCPRMTVSDVHFTPTTGTSKGGTSIANAHSRGLECERL